MHHIDRFLYINLDHRKDRKEEFLAECARVGVPPERVERVAGIHTPHPRGHVGCRGAHLAALELARERKYPVVAIMEDDFNWEGTRDEVQSKVQGFFDEKRTFRVCMLSSNIMRSEPCGSAVVARVYDAQTASGYIVHHSFYDTFISHLRHVATTCGEHAHDGAIDQCWKRFQDRDWYAFRPRLGYQRKSFSDIAGRVVFYGDC